MSITAYITHVVVAPIPLLIYFMITIWFKLQYKSMRNKLLHFSEPVCGFKLLNCLTGVLVKTHKIVVQSPEFLLIKLSMTRSIQIRNNNFILKNLIISSCSWCWCICWTCQAIYSRCHLSMFLSSIIDF